MAFLGHRVDGQETVCGGDEEALNRRRGHPDSSVGQIVVAEPVEMPAHDHIPQRSAGNGTYYQI